MAFVIDALTPADPPRERAQMPEYMDVHRGMEGITPEQLLEAHNADLAIQDDEQVNGDDLERQQVRHRRAHPRPAGQVRDVGLRRRVLDAQQRLLQLQQKLDAPKLKPADKRKLEAELRRERDHFNKLQQKIQKLEKAAQKDKALEKGLHDVQKQANHILNQPVTVDAYIATLYLLDLQIGLECRVAGEQTRRLIVLNLR